METHKHSTICPLCQNGFERPEERIGTYLFLRLADAKWSGIFQVTETPWYRYSLNGMIRYFPTSLSLIKQMSDKISIEDAWTDNPNFQICPDCIEKHITKSENHNA